jgi:predicted enzyme related to lactoylglutathione lyase
MGVTGIGGFFFRAKDPEAMRAWYVEHLGVGSAPYGAWETEAGTCVFAPFAADTGYFAADRQWMLNLRVDDLDKLCGTLRAADVVVTTKVEWDMPGVGRFARIHDPEGNPIELWEPDRAA